MKTAGRIFLCAAIAAAAASCSLADLGSALSSTGLNILGKPEDYASVIISSSTDALASAAPAGVDAEGNMLLEGFSIPTSLSPEDKVYGRDDSIIYEISMVLEMDGGAEALASKLTSKVEGEALAVLSNTAALYGDILGYAVSQYGSSLAGEAASIVSEVQSGLSTLSQSEDLTEADAVLVQAMASLVYSSLDLLSEMQSLPEGSSIADAQGLQAIISQAGLLVSYSEAVKDTARSTLPGTLSGLYDRLVSIVEGQGGAV